VLIGGDPGIGKSTLLLQALARCRSTCKRALRERRGIRAQVALRARRLGMDGGSVEMLAEIQLERILSTLETRRRTSP
jgi:DNA repair protein RadA/Sms